MKKQINITSYFMNILLGVALLFSMSFSFAKTTNTQTLMLVGYDGKSWFPYVAKITRGKPLKSNDWKKIKTIRNPAYLTLQPQTGNIYVKGNDGRLYRYTSKNKVLKLLLPSGNGNETQLNNYTQLRANKNGLVMVELVEGKSRDTRLVYVDDAPSSLIVKLILKQASAQFHPVLSGKSLFYAHVSCRAVCSPIIQEVWKQDRVTGKAQQLTLLNATSYLHSVDSQERFGFISSNQHGYYHIAKLDLASNKVTWLTQGQVTDSYPSVSDDAIYFIRRTPKGTKLMSLNIESDNVNISPRTVSLPHGIKKIRYLELTH